VAACARLKDLDLFAAWTAAEINTAAKVRGFSIELTDKGDGELYQAAAREVKVQWLKEGEQTQMYTAGGKYKPAFSLEINDETGIEVAHVDGVDSYHYRVPCKDGRLMYIKKERRMHPLAVAGHAASMIKLFNTARR